MKTKNNKLISVIIPCYNSYHFLNRAIDSVLNQTWPEFEIILVNDGSSDKKTLKIFDSYSHIKKFKLINQNNSGLSAARNKGVQNASGDYLFFLDSDDWIEPEALEEMFNFLKKFKENRFVFTDIVLEGDACKTIHKNYNLFEQLFLNQLPYSIFISKKNWLKNGGYDENMRSGYEDWDFNIRLGAAKIYGLRLSKPLFHYNVSHDGMLLSKSSKLHSQIWNYIINKNKSQYSIKSIIIMWQKWRKKKSIYPLFIFLLWYVVFKYLPQPVTTKLFIMFRNIKWFFSRNKNTII